MKRSLTKGAGTALKGAPVLMVGLLLAGCFTKDAADRWPCPATSVNRAESGLCECLPEGPEVVEGAQFLASGWGKPCARCNAQDGNGGACICEDGTFMDNDVVRCLDCPPCDGRSCRPDGCAPCEGDLPCAPGTTCGQAGQCLACQPGMCGGQCGACPFGQICVEGGCQPGILCCLSDNTGAFCSRGADFCVFPPAPGASPGAPCYCNVLNSEGGSYCSTQFTGFVAGPGMTCR